MLLRVADFIEIFEKLPYIPRYVIQECAEVGNKKLAALEKHNDELEHQMHSMRIELNNAMLQLTRMKNKPKTTKQNGDCNDSTNQDLAAA